MTKVSFSTQYVQLQDYMQQLRVNIDLFTIRGQKKAAFDARKNLQGIAKIVKTMRKDIQDAKKGMPTRKRTLKNAPVAAAPAKKVVVATKGKPVVAKKTAEEVEA